MNRVKDMNEVMTGIFLILVSLLAFYLSWPLSRSTEVGLGPGYVPKVFAFIQLVIGMIMIVDGFLEAGEASEPWHLRPLVLILASVAFFAVTIESLGLVIALTGLVLISCAANRETKLFQAIALAFGSVIFSVLVFVKALSLQIPMWPPNLWGS